MITRFSTLYVGHIELEACGLTGAPADSRRYPNRRLIETFDTAAALAQATDELGYETLWLAEHHFQHEGYECIPTRPKPAPSSAPGPTSREHAKFMAPLGMLRYSEEHVSAVAARQAQSPTGATLENGVRNRSWLCGPPARIVDYLNCLEAKYPGLEHVMIAWALGTPRELMLEQLTRFATEVMPAFTPPATT